MKHLNHPIVRLRKLYYIIVTHKMIKKQQIHICVEERKKGGASPAFIKKIYILKDIALKIL